MAQFERLHSETSVKITNVVGTHTNTFSGETDPFVTLARTQSGRLKLNTWTFDNITANSFSLAQTYNSGKMGNSFAMQLLAEYSGPGTDLNSKVITAIRDSSNRIKLIIFRISHGGGITRISDSHNVSPGGGPVLVASPPNIMDKVKQLDIDVVGSPQQNTLRGTARVLTAYRTLDDNLKLVVWDISDDWSKIVSRGSATAGRISDVKISSFGDFAMGVFQNVASYLHKIQIYLCM